MMGRTGNEEGIRQAETMRTAENGRLGTSFPQSIGGKSM